MNKKRYIAFVLLLLISIQIEAQYAIPSELKVAHKEVYGLEFTAARNHLRAYEESNPSHISIPYMRFSILFLKHFVDEDAEAFERDEPIMDELLELIEDAPKTNPYRYLYLGEMNLQMAALSAKFGHTWSAAQSGLSGLRALEDGQEKFPEFIPMFAGIGILNVALGSIPDNYKFVASVLGFSGDVDLGMTYLRRAVDASKSNPEYAYLLEKHVFLYVYVLQQLQPDRANNLTNYGVNPMENPLMAFLEAKILQNQGENDELIELLETVQSLPQRHGFPYLNYLLGRAKLARGDQDANVALSEYLKTNKGENYNISTHRYLSWHYRLQGDQQRSELHRAIAAAIKETKVGADLEAQRESQLPPMPVELLKARLAFDNGDYHQALRLLDGGGASFCHSDADYLEYYYRLGRIYQELDNVQNAIRYYRNTLDFQPFPVSFNRVNAELNLAMLLERTHPAQAKIHYQNVLGFKNFPWFEGTQQKAKAGLERLEAR